jgi:hypothetical protein
MVVVPQIEQSHRHVAPVNGQPGVVTDTGKCVEVQSV